MDKKRPKKSAGRRGAPAETAEWNQRSSSVLWLKLNFTIKAARLQTLKRQKYQHLQEEALLKDRGLLKNWEDGPVLLTEDLYSRAKTEHEAQEILNYTPEALALRFGLRNHPEVADAVKQLWSVDLPRDELGCIDQKGYASLFRRIGRTLEPEATKRRLRRMEKTIKEDWIRDNKGEPTMSFASFFDSVFELADLWCETIDADEYVEFLRRLVLRISSIRQARSDPNSEARRLLRPLKQIKAIDNDEESSSSEELSPSEVDDEEEFSSDGSSSEEEEEDESPVRLPPPLTPSPSLGFIATKALQTMRVKTPPATSGTPEINFTPESVLDDRPRSRERRASIISIGDFGIGGLGSFKGFPGAQDDKETGSKTPTSVRVASAKSRTTSANRKPLTTMHEKRNGNTNTDEGGGINALVPMTRLRSAQPRTPIVVEDAGPSSEIPNNKMSLNESLPMGNYPQQKQERNAQLFTGDFGATKSEIGVGNVNMDGLPSSGGMQSASALTRSAPRLKTATGLTSSTFGSVDTARVGSGGAHRAKLFASSANAKQKGEKKPVGIVFEDANQSKGNYKRLAALSVNSVSSTNKSSAAQNSNQDAARIKFVFAEGDIEEERSSTIDAQSTAPAPQQYVSGFGFDIPAKDVVDISKKTGIVSTNTSLPFYTFDENASPAKRLLPPVLGDSANRGQSAARRHRQGRASAQSGLDFSESYKKTAYLSGSLQAQIVAQSQRRVSGSRNADERSTTPLSFPLSGKESRSHSRRSTSKQTPKRIQKLTRDDEYGDGTVSPWDTEFDDDPDLTRAFPHAKKHREKMDTSHSPVSTSELLTGPQRDISPIDPPTLSVSSSMVPPEPPSCVSELTTLPQEYHELVLGGSALNYKSLSRTESAPVTFASPQAPVIHTVNSLSREPQWMLHGTSQPALTLLENGVEGRTVVNSSPRSIFTALTAKRSRRERDAEEEESGLCPRFVEHLECHGERATTALSPQFRTEKPNPRCTCSEFTDDQEAPPRCPRHGNSNNNWQENEEQVYFPMEEAVNSQTEDVTVIVNATRGLVLRPGTVDELAAKRARHKQNATRSEMMRRRCQFTFAKHLG